MSKVEFIMHRHECSWINIEKWLLKKIHTLMDIHVSIYFFQSLLEWTTVPNFRFCFRTHQRFTLGKPPRPMTMEQLVTFLNDYQRDPRLNEILYPYADNNRAKEVIAQYETSKDNVTRSESGALANIWSSIGSNCFVRNKVFFFFFFWGTLFLRKLYLKNFNI